MKKNVTREAVVVVIDDDASVRAALKELIESVGLEARLYASALRAVWSSMCGCPE
jgi:FixJ family two-component response regulator